VTSYLIRALIRPSVKIRPMSIVICTPTHDLKIFHNWKPHSGTDLKHSMKCSRCICLKIANLSQQNLPESHQYSHKTLSLKKLSLTHQSLLQHLFHVTLLQSPHLKPFIPKNPMGKVNLVDKLHLWMKGERYKQRAQTRQVYTTGGRVEE
jgi:hypothetical protein